MLAQNFGRAMEYKMVEMTITCLFTNEITNLVKRYNAILLTTDADTNMYHKSASLYLC